MSYFRQMQQILNDKSISSDGEEKLAALTASERTAWARVREEFFSKGINKTSLDLIEKAAFIVVLDDIPYIYDPVSDINYKIIFYSLRYFFIKNKHVKRKNNYFK